MQSFLSWSSDSPSEKREPRGTTSLPNKVVHFVRASNLISYHKDCRRICRAQPLGIWMWQEGNGLATTSTWILADWVHTGSAKVVIPTSNFAYLQNQVGDGLSPRNLEGCRCAWIGSLSKEFLLALEPSLCIPKQWVESEPYTLWRVAPSEKRAGDNWKLCSPVVL